jgi:hypothetical protein
MNTQLTIKTRRLLFNPTFVTLLIGIVMTVLSSSAVQAQTTDAAAPVDSSITLTANGAVTDPNGSVTITGSVIITCRRVIDTTNATTTPLVLLDLDFSQLKGTSGNGKNQRVYITGDNHTDEIRPLQASDTVIVTVPYFDSAKGSLTARSFLATAALKFDVTTGKLTSGTITVGNNVITSATVGTVTATTPQ